MLYTDLIILEPEGLNVFILHARKPRLEKRNDFLKPSVIFIWYLAFNNIFSKLLTFLLATSFWSFNSHATLLIFAISLYLIYQ